MNKNAFLKHLLGRWGWLLATGTLAALLPGAYASADQGSPSASPGSGARTINFSGYSWTVKSSTEPVGPGPNYFSDSTESVWVDGSGSLHMKIAQRGGRWYSSEVMCELPLKYGSYSWEITSPLSGLDPNAVLGLFTWDDNAPEYHYREIDIEIARWQNPSGPNIQYVIQPYDTPGSRYQFTMPLTHSSVHRFAWSAEQVQFESLEAEQQVSWTFARPVDIPPEGTGNPRINLWLVNGTPPVDGKDIEVVIRSFNFRYPNVLHLPFVSR